MTATRDPRHDMWGPRRSPAETPRLCPNCLRRVGDLAAHLRDTGQMVEQPIWSCPVLFQKRNRQ